MGFFLCDFVADWLVTRYSVLVLRPPKTTKDTTHLFNPIFQLVSVWASMEKKKEDFQRILPTREAQTHCLSCNTHYYTGTWASLNDFHSVSACFMLSWKALLVSCVLCRTFCCFKPLRPTLWWTNAETQGQGLLYAEKGNCAKTTPNSI